MTDHINGAFTFVLHSHLPYARQAGMWPHGEEWVHEALAETYLPLLDALYDLREEGVPFRLTIGLAVTGLFAVTALVAPALLAGPWWVYGGLASLMVLLSVGGLERYIRRRVGQRALPPG